MPQKASSIVIDRRIVLRGVLLVAAITPTFYGISAIFFPTYIVEFSGASIDGSPTSYYILNVLGVYIFMFAVALWYAFLRPEQSQSIINWCTILFILRGLQRLLSTEKLQTLFSVEPHINYLHVLYLILLGSLMLWLNLSYNRGRKAKNIMPQEK